MNEFLDMRKKELKLLIIEFNRGSQLDRSLAKTEISKEKKLLFRKTLIEKCLELMSDIDDDKITNKKIRDTIRKIKNIDSNISFGQAQKVINVCLKQYAFITNKENCIDKLDCPLDTITMKGYKIKNNRMINVKEDDYVKYQEIFEKENSYRIKQDLKYDDNRIRKFFDE